MNDPYTILGVASTATDEEISRAYKKLARQYHPDLHPGDKAAETRMKEINSAYESIKDIRSGKKSYSAGTGSSYGSGANTYGSYGTYGNTEDPFAEYRSAYGSRYYGFDFSDLFREQQQRETRRTQSFGFFTVLRSLFRAFLTLSLLRFLFSLLFFPVF